MGKSVRSMPVGSARVGVATWPVGMLAGGGAGGGAVLGDVGGGGVDGKKRQLTRCITLPMMAKMTTDIKIAANILSPWRACTKIRQRNMT